MSLCVAARFGAVLLFGFTPALVSAQFPVPAATGRSINLSVGYSYLNLAITPSTRVSLSGVETGFTLGIGSKFGVIIDASYMRVSNVLGSKFHSDLLSYLSGPVLYPLHGRRLTTYLRGLIGGARETGATPLNGGFVTGWVNKFSWACGGGAEYKLSHSLGFRSGADYLHTAYFNGSSAIRGQGNIRATGTVIFYFDNRSTRGN